MCSNSNGQQKPDLANLTCVLLRISITRRVASLLSDKSVHYLIILIYLGSNNNKISKHLRIFILCAETQGDFKKFVNLTYVHA